MKHRYSWELAETFLRILFQLKIRRFYLTNHLYPKYARWRSYITEDLLLRGDHQL